MRDHYKPGDPGVWKGRVDDPADRESYRWHQIIETIDLNTPSVEDHTDRGRRFCLLGFACDEGVRRNKGRVGAALGPEAIRSALASLPWHGSDDIYDAGNVSCEKGDLEAAQEALAAAIGKIRERGLYPIVLGGGHEVSFGHFEGLRRSLPLASQRTLGIINFDAHFDIRSFAEQPSSGTMFAQIAQLRKELSHPFRYLCLGVQKSGNTRSLFQKARRLGAEYVLAEDLGQPGDPAFRESEDRIRGFIDSCETLYTTVCSDVLAADAAPGVSAPQPLGLQPQVLQKWLNEIVRTGKTIGFDIAEISPPHDGDMRSAKLAALLVFKLLEAFE